MKNILKYKDFIGSVNFSSDDDIFFGKIEDIDDLVTFEGDNVKEIKKSFQEAVNDYIEICTIANKKLHKSYKGTFNIRLTPKLHRTLALKSIENGISINQLVQSTLEKEFHINLK